MSSNLKLFIFTKVQNLTEMTFCVGACDVGPVAWGNLGFLPQRNKHLRLFQIFHTGIGFLIFLYLVGYSIDF